MVDWSHKVPSRAKSIVNNHWNACIVGDLRDLLEIWDVVAWVADAFDLVCVSKYFEFLRDGNVRR